MKNKLNDIVLKEFAKKILFENELNEIFQLDDDMHAGKNVRHSMFDTPGPIIDGDNNYDNITDIIDMPISPEDISANQLHSARIDINDLLAQNYIPSNEKELAKSLKDAIEQIQLSDKDIEKFWLEVKRFLNNRK